MIYEFRTYDILPGTLDKFGSKTAEKISKRIEYSDLAAFWYSDIGPLNQVIHVWPYENLEHRREIRSQVVSDGIWPPDNNDVLIRMQSDIMIPAPFMDGMVTGSIGPVFEIRTYLYRPGEIPKVLDAWENAIETRKKYSSLVGCWYSDIGELNKLIHIWAYSSLEERSNIRSEVVERGVWPPKSGISPTSQENKIVLPFEFSPIR